MARSQNRPDVTERLRLVSSTRPKGEQVYEHLVALAADLPSGAMLPSERVLAERFGVSRPTVRTQVDELVRQGLATRVIGSGTFAAEPRLPIAPTLPSFSREIRALGMTPGARLISANTRPASEVEAASLGVAGGSPILELVRLRTADATPMSLEHTRYSLIRYPGLDSAPLDQGSMRDHLNDIYGSGGTQAERRFTIASIDERSAVLLHVPPGSPVFRAEVTIRDPDDSVVEVGTALLRADRYEIRMHVDTLVGRAVTPRVG